MVNLRYDCLPRSATPSTSGNRCRSSIVGRERIPTFADAPRLPYVRAIIKEIFQWHPTITLGVPHVVTEEDWYEGMYIPKGTICISNIWHCNHDRAVFGEDAEEFRPERHLDDNGETLAGPVETNQTGHVAFGLGDGSA